jgi:flagellar hook-associated protein 2
MAGTISSLGIGSNVLTSSVIDQLKAADTASIINPITNKITLQQQKGKALTLLSSLLSTFQTSVNALGNDTMYQARTVSGNTSSVSVTAASGVNVQSFSISNTQLALNDVKESGSFANADTTSVASGSGTLSLSSGGINYSIGYKSGMTLNDLKDAINAKAGDKITASTLQVGTNDFRLILRSKDTGLNQSISMSDSSGGTLDTKLYSTYNATTNPTGVQSIQAAKDASFTYNGIALTRASNTITDITPGVTINLLANDTASTANISIAQDVSAVSSEMTNLVQSYNTLTTQLSAMTTTDTAAGKVGVFNGDSSINAISREVTRLMTSMNSTGNSLVQYGINLDQNGTMSFNSATFTTKYNANVTTSNTFFSHVADSTNKEDGIFTQLGTLMTRYTGSTGIMGNLTTGADTDLKVLNANKTRAQTLLDARYATMTARFTQYDSIISKLNNQFSSLSQQITMAANGKA